MTETAVVTAMLFYTRQLELKGAARDNNTTIREQSVVPPAKDNATKHTGVTTNRPSHDPSTEYSAWSVPLQRQTKTCHIFVLY
jgi:hypothetical protein